MSDLAGESSFSEQAAEGRRLWSDQATELEAAKFRVVRGRLPMPDGSESQREVVVHPGAVVILPWLDHDTVVMIRNQRFAIGRELWELPAGTLEASEDDPADCARRELVEETGYEAGRVLPIMAIYSAPGFCTERLYCYEAFDLRRVGQRLEATEAITAHPLPLSEVLDMIDRRVIVDAKTLAVLLDAARRRQKQEQA